MRAQTQSVGTPPAQAAVPRRHIAISLALAVVLSAYAFLAFSISAAKPPSVDEGWLAVSANNLAVHGNTGNPLLEPTGFWVGNDLPGIQEVNYLNMPLHLVTEAVWFHFLGFSIVSMRALSILWGAVALLSWFAIVASFADSVTALFCVGLLAIDFTFLWTAADGRMDTMCMALWSAGIALYLRYREQSLERSLILANTAVAASMLTHPNGFLGFLLLAVLVFRMDRYRLERRHAMALLPYVVGVAAWAAYASLHPTYFLAQFGINIAKTPGRLHIYLPWDSVLGEIAIRYLAHFAGFHTWSSPVPAYAIVIILLYWGACVTLIPAALQRRSPAARKVLATATILFAGLALLVGFKAPNYLINVVPAYVACFAAAVIHGFRRRGDAGAAAVLATALLVFVQFSVFEYKLAHSEYADYRATVQFVKQRASTNPRILASSYFYFDLQGLDLHDDSKIGYRSYLHPTLIIADPWYQDFWNKVFPFNNPGAWLYVSEVLQNHVRPVFSAGRYTVYEVH